MQAATEAEAATLVSQRMLADHRLAGWLNQFDEQKSKDDRHDFLMVLSDALEDFGYEDGAACLRWCAAKGKWPWRDYSHQWNWFDTGSILFRGHDKWQKLPRPLGATEEYGKHPLATRFNPNNWVEFRTVAYALLWLIDHWPLIKAEMKTW